MLELSIVVQVAGLVLTFFGLGFSYHKWRETVTHKRISEVKQELQSQIDELDDNIVRRDEFQTLAGSLKESLKDIKDEQHKMSSRFDEFFMKFIERSLNNSGNKS